MNMRIKKRNILSLSVLSLLFLLPFFYPHLNGAVKVEEYELKIAMIKHFFDFIKWPPGNSTSGQFIFGIIGDTPISEQAEKLYKQITIPEKEIYVKTIPNADLAKLKECNVLIIGNIEAERLKEILSIIGDLPILSISDTEGFAEIGVLINLIKAENKVKFEINYSAVKRSGLVFSSKLYKLARLIDYPR